MTQNGHMVSGTLQAKSAADLRSALHRQGLQVVRFRPVRFGAVQTAKAGLFPRLLGAVSTASTEHKRSRRREARAELIEGLQALLSSGLTLEASLEELATERATRSLVGDLLRGVRSGERFSVAAESRPDWFDYADIAMLRAAEQAGELQAVLETLAARQRRSGQLMSTVLGVLAYPAVVVSLGLGALVFMSRRTLPDLVTILADADVPTPALTRWVITTGEMLSSPLTLILGLILLGGIVLGITVMISSRIGIEAMKRCAPRLVRDTTVGRAMRSMAELIRAGLSVTEALRTTAPTLGPLSGRVVGMGLNAAAERIENGASLADALEAQPWLGGATARLVRLGESTGELDDMAERLADRLERRAGRSVDRLVRLLEPIVILVLAVAVGIVVMAAVLPLVRLQEII
ncbi:MAG: type II secretion system F family protein [Planctomycetota bacterium]